MVLPNNGIELFAQELYDLFVESQRLRRLLWNALAQTTHPMFASKLFPVSRIADFQKHSS